MSLNKKINLALVAGAVSLATLVACGPQPYDAQDAKSMIKAVEKAVGGKAGLHALKDVQFNYDYDQVSAGTKDVSVERYRFADEASYAKYSEHKVHVAPNLEGEVEQSLLKGQASFKHKGEALEDPPISAGSSSIKAKLSKTRH